MKDNTENKKIGWISSFWESCVDLNFYPKALKASWLHTIIHSIFLAILIAIAYSVATLSPLTKSIEKYLQGIPIVKIKDGKALPEDPSIKLPYVRTFKNANKKFHYIIDNGKNTQELEEKYALFVLVNDKNLMFSDSFRIEIISFKELQKSLLFQKYFGSETARFTPANLAKFIASTSLAIIALLFSVLIFFVLPINNLVLASIASVADKWSLPFSQILKLSFFAATPACIIQAFGCFLLGGTGLISILFLISFMVQGAYLITGLRAYKASLDLK